MPARKNREGRRVTKLKRDAREVIKGVKEEASQLIEEYRNALIQVTGQRDGYKKKYIGAMVVNILLSITLITGVWFYVV